MPPKASAKAAKGPAPPLEPDPAAQVRFTEYTPYHRSDSSMATPASNYLSCKHLLVQLPPDIPTECPFKAEWHAAVCTVHSVEGLNLPAIKDAFKQLKVMQQLSLADLAARLEPSDPLVAEVAAAEAANAAAAASGGPARCENLETAYQLRDVSAFGHLYHACLLSLTYCSQLAWAGAHSSSCWWPQKPNRDLG
jgi:hypothetical protein